jgi:D-alanyl-D-alanine carboxypeptidase
MFTVASIMQLMEQGKLSLQDKLTAVLPNDTLYKDLLVFNGKDYIDSVRIVNLLNHSSGFPEYFIEGDDTKELELHSDSSLRFTPYGLIEMAKKTNKPQFVPGTKFKYCNVNYILLGLIIEKLTGKTYQQYIQEHIIDPLGLKHTYFGSVNPPANRTAGHFKGNISVMPATLAWAAGEIISDLDDMHTFIREWNKGTLFSNPSTIESLKKDNYQNMLAGVIQYGMGCVKISDQSFGHGGETFGFQSYMGVLKNNYSFVLGIDDASVSAWEPAMNLTTLFSSLK